MALAPGKQAAQGGAICSIAGGRGLGTLGGRKNAAAMTVEGQVASLASTKDRAVHVRRLLCGEALADLLEGRALDETLELSHRIHAWTCAVADDTVLAAGLVEAMDASRGLAHLLPVAIERVARARPTGPARFGDVLPENGALPASRVAAELGTLERLAASEREGLFEAAEVPRPRGIAAFVADAFARLTDRRS